MAQPKPRNFDCPGTGEPCTDGRCTQEVCCELERIKVEEGAERIAAKDRAYWNEYWRDPEVRERERQRLIQQELSEIHRRIMRDT